MSPFLVSYYFMFIQRPLNKDCYALHPSFLFFISKLSFFLTLSGEITSRFLWAFISGRLARPPGQPTKTYILDLDMPTIAVIAFMAPTATVAVGQAATKYFFPSLHAGIRGTVCQASCWLYFCNFYIENKCLKREYIYWQGHWKSRVQTHPPTLFVIDIDRWH